MEITKRIRLNKVEIENEYGKPTRIIFRSTSFLEGLDVELENMAETLILTRDREGELILGTDTTYKMAIDVLKALHQEAILAQKEAALS